ncbi:MAG: rod shape-determining protein MreC [Hyphomicrobiaceae bacterium]|nr:rod shape-determining protein MreC [Hyphomicrobiaceae bacterium]
MGGWLLFALYFASLVLLVFSRLENDQIREVRGLFTDLISPVLHAASQPAIYARRSKEQLGDYLDLFEELDRLKEENQKLKIWAWRAQRMERRLEHMNALLNAVEETALKYASGHVIADARGPFAKSVLINLGRKQGVRNGYAVVDGDGLIGRVVHSGDTASRAILVNDLNSRIPVVVGPAAVRAVLVGDNTDEPRLEFLPNSAAVYEGDTVSTSGHGGLLPRGLQIGVISRSGKPHRVRTHAALGELEYVSVLFYDSPVVAAQEAPSVAPKPVASKKPSAGKRRKAANLQNKHVKAGEKVQAR